MKLKLNSSWRPLCPDCGEGLYASGHLYLGNMWAYRAPWNDRLTASPTNEHLQGVEILTLYCIECGFETDELDDIEYEPFDIAGEDSCFTREIWRDLVVKGKTSDGYWTWVENEKRKKKYGQS